MVNMMLQLKLLILITEMAASGFIMIQKKDRDKHSIEVTCGNSNKWKKATVTLSDAYFGDRGKTNSDFSIRSTNNGNVIFAVVELSRPKNFDNAIIQSQSLAATGSGGSEAQLSITNDITANKKGLWIYPNPVQEIFSAQLKDNSNITDIEVYSQAGQLLLQRKTSATIVRMHKRELVLQQEFIM